MCLLKRSISAEVENAILSTVAEPCQYESHMAQPVEVSQQVAICSSKMYV
jgi:hypothetical protein